MARKKTAAPSGVDTVTIEVGGLSATYPADHPSDYTMMTPGRHHDKQWEPPRPVHPLVAQRVRIHAAFRELAAKAGVTLPAYNSWLVDPYYPEPPRK